MGVQRSVPDVRTEPRAYSTEPRMCAAEHPTTVRRAPQTCTQDGQTDARRTIDALDATCMKTQQNATSPQCTDRTGHDGPPDGRTPYQTGEAARDARRKERRGRLSSGAALSPADGVRNEPARRDSAYPPHPHTHARTLFTHTRPLSTRPTSAPTQTRGKREAYSGVESWMCGAESRLCGTELRMYSVVPWMCGAELRRGSAVPRMCGTEPRMCSTEPRVYSAESRMCNTEPGCAAQCPGCAAQSFGCAALRSGCAVQSPDVRHRVPSVQR